MKVDFKKWGKSGLNMALAVIELIYIFLIMMGITPPSFIELIRSLGVTYNYLKQAISAEFDQKKTMASNILAKKRVMKTSPGVKYKRLTSGKSTNSTEPDRKDMNNKTSVKASKEDRKSRRANDTIINIED